MRAALLLALIAAVQATNLKNMKYYEERFTNWLSEHGLPAPSAENFKKMLQNYANNDDIIELHNSKNATFTLGHNQFSHMSREEWREYVRLGLDRPAYTAASIHTAPANPAELTGELDWVANGAVTDPKDQGSCGSCWSFSTTGALEGAYKIKYGQLKSFSEQQLVDCDNFLHGGSDHGCNGGLMDNAFAWVKKNGGLCSEADYAYISGTTQKSGSCDQSKCTNDPKVAPSSFTDVQTNSDTALMSALNKGPVSVAIEADQSAFQLYKSGVFTAACGSNLDHGVLAVGYGTRDGTDYYKVKNSWGANWGEGGYILLARGVSQKEGQCGILSGPPSFPNL